MIRVTKKIHLLYLKEMINPVNLFLTVPQVSRKTFRHYLEIRKGTNYAPLNAYLFLFSDELQFKTKFYKNSFQIF